MKKYLLDTSVLLHDSEAIYNFEDNEVIIPREVLLELNKKKEQESQVGKNAREIIRNLRKIFLEDIAIDGFDFKIQENLTEKINEGKITLYFDQEFFYPYFEVNNFEEDINENKFNNLKMFRKLNHNINNEIKNVTDLRLIEIARKNQSILITKDYTLQLLSMQLGVPVQDYKTDQTFTNCLYKGYSKLKVATELIDKIYNKGQIKFNKIGFENNESEKAVDMVNNQFFELKSYDNNKTALVRFNDGKFKLIKKNRHIHGITPKNREQLFVADLLLSEGISLVTISGISGTGKTLLSLVAGLEQVSNLNRYHKLIITRPTVSLGNEIGFLPGSLEEKLKPWMKPIYDNIDYITDGNAEEVIEGLKSYNKLQIEPLQYIRGRSMPHQFIIIDEAQNLSPKQIKAVISRAGEGTKIVLTGDIEQIDQPYLSKRSNALSYVIDKFKGEDNYGHVEMVKSERSRLAEQASKLL